MRTRHLTSTGIAVRTQGLVATLDVVPRLMPVEDRREDGGSPRLPPRPGLPVLLGRPLPVIADIMARHEA